VGAFGAGMAALQQRGLDVAIQEAVGRGTFLVGICLGMQFLFDESEEMGRHAGLGLIPGRVRRFAAVAPADEPGASLLKVPHIGWNQIEYDRQSPLLAGIANGAYAYFVHSYYCMPAELGDIMAQTEYGSYFTAIAGRGNVFGIQFHPEKSQQVGRQIIYNFVALA
jgi:glutamine amidotransferase